MVFDMDLKRFFTDNIVVGEEALLTGEEFIHAVKVTRHKVGYEIIICDNTGFDYYCVVTAIEKDKLFAKVNSKIINQTELQEKINLFIGVNKDLDTVIQKAIELGVSKITPFYSQHTNVENINYQRLSKIVLESSKQCGRAKLAQIGECVSYDTMLENLQGNNYFFYEYERDNKVSNAKYILGQPINIIIGGEGGFSKEEVAKMIDMGACLLTLGKRILRVSTAVVSAISLVLQKIGEI